MSFDHGTTKDQSTRRHEASPVAQDANEAPEQVPVGMFGAESAISEITSSIANFDAGKISKGMATLQIATALNFT